MGQDHSVNSASVPAIYLVIVVLWIFTRPSSGHVHQIRYRGNHFEIIDLQRHNIFTESTAIQGEPI
jgi:hypothetical protein